MGTARKGQEHSTILVKSQRAKDASKEASHEDATRLCSLMTRPDTSQQDALPMVIQFYQRLQRHSFIKWILTNVRLVPKWTHQIVLYIIKEEKQSFYLLYCSD